MPGLGCMILVSARLPDGWLAGNRPPHHALWYHSKLTVGMNGRGGNGGASFREANWIIYFSNLKSGPLLLKFKSQEFDIFVFWFFSESCPQGSGWLELMIWPGRRGVAGEEASFRLSWFITSNIIPSHTYSTLNASMEKLTAHHWLFTEH